MKEYRRLTEKEQKKIIRNKRIKRQAKRQIKNMFIAGSVVIILCVGIVALYKVVDGLHGDEDSTDYPAVQKASANLSGQKAISDEEDERLEGEREFSEENDTKTSEGEEKSTEKNDKGHVSVDFSEWNKTCKREFTIVNRFSKAYDGEPVRTKLCRGKEVGFELAEDLENMILDARSEGIILWISSGYRSINHQTKLFNRQIEREKQKGLDEQKAIEAAESVVARPGTSEHNLGLAVDFNGVDDDFYKTKEYKWLIENAHRYGFIERYKKEWQKITGVIPEPWHFRYVGKEQAIKIKESGMCLEEYVSRVLMGRSGTGGVF